jgi:hypothetical protein
MTRSIAALAWLVVLLIAVAPRAATACSCMSSGPACQAYWTTEAVFDATVLQIIPLNPAGPPPLGELRFADKIVKLDVRQSWKGVETGPLEITTGPEGGGCGFSFKEGGRYLVFAHRGRLDGRLQASICSLTQEFNGSGAAADFLASLSAPTRGGRIFGTVRTAQRVFDPERPRTEAATETLVRLSGGGQERTTTSAGGRYEFTGLSEGPYRVEVLVPDGHTVYSASREVQIPDRRACAEENYSLSPAGRIAGRLVGPDGRGLSRIHVETTSPDVRSHPLYGLAIASATTDTEGYFEIDALPPGRYVIGVNLKDLPSEYNPYARTVYPGGTAQPHIVTLSLGQTVDLGTWQMPPPLAVVRITGMVTWNDGSPAVGVYVGVSDRTGNPVERARGAGGATSGQGGRFVLEVRQGRTYTFTASDRQSGQLPVSAPRLEIGAAPEPVRIVIQREPPRQ